MRLCQKQIIGVFNTHEQASSATCAPIHTANQVYAKVLICVEGLRQLVNVKLNVKPLEKTTLTAILRHTHTHTHTHTHQSTWTTP